jgi:hypothetical protein
MRTSGPAAGVACHSPPALTTSVSLAYHETWAVQGRGYDGATPTADLRPHDGRGRLVAHEVSRLAGCVPQRQAERAMTILALGPMPACRCPPPPFFFDAAARVPDLVTSEDSTWP